MTLLYVIFGGLIVAWLPHLWSFLRAWWVRRNPISLAIFLTILLVVYTNVFAVVHLRWRVAGNTSAWVYAACSLVTAVYFYVAKSWARVRFPDSRKPNDRSPP